MIPPTATFEEIAAALRSGLSVAETVRRLHAGKARVTAIRNAIHVPPARPGRRVAADLASDFYPRARRRNGHLIWVGTITGGHPRLRHQGEYLSAYKAAFILRTGRQPLGYCKADCGVELCVEPQHVDDAAGRARYDAIFGEAL
jgi:hypothetical protein